MRTGEDGETAEIGPDGEGSESFAESDRIRAVVDAVLAGVSEKIGGNPLASKLRQALAAEFRTVWHVLVAPCAASVDFKRSHHGYYYELEWKGLRLMLLNHQAPESASSEFVYFAVKKIESGYFRGFDKLFICFVLV